MAPTLGENPFQWFKLAADQGNANAQLSFFSSVAAYDSAGFNST